MSGLLERIGLGRAELRAWAMYDWANSAFMTTIVAAVFPIYFSRVAAGDLQPAEATWRFALATTVALSIVAVLSPFLGALADCSGSKKRLLGAFMGLGVLATGCMFFIQQGDMLLALVLFILGNIGATGSFVFYDSLLPHIAAPKEIDRVSTAGYALGYVGGGLLLLVNLAWIQVPELFGIAGAGLAMRLSFLSVAVWWLGFSIPLFRRVPEPRRGLEADEEIGVRAMRAALTRLAETLRELRTYRQAFLMLMAFLVYNDGIGTIIRMATTYGTEIGIPQGALITALVLVQFVGIPFAFLFGQIASRVGPKRSIFLALVVYHGRQRARLLHADRCAFLRARDPRRHGAGREPGAEPIDVRRHDPTPQVLGVLRVLRRFREIRRYRGPGGLCAHHLGDRIEPQRDSVGHLLLRCGRHSAVVRRRRGRPEGRPGS